MAPVPGAIQTVGGKVMLAEIDENLRPDLDDLAVKAVQAFVLLLSHMRRRLCDMNRLIQICDAACATIMSGSCMSYERHGAGPEAATFEGARYDMPNCSARMDALRAAILRPQPTRLDDNIARWATHYGVVERALITAAATRGVEVKWFGAKVPVGFTSLHQSWCYVAAYELPETDRAMATLFDMRLPLSFSEDVCALIAELICEAVYEVAK